MLVAQDLIDMRSSELRAAYPGVIGFGVGFRKRRDRNGRTRIARKPLVHLRFMVERKWPRSAPGLKRTDRIPAFLLTSVGALTNRTVLAIPTDVQGRPHPRHVSRQALAVTAIDGSISVDGALACIVRERSGTQRRYFGISCRHVLSPAGDIEGMGQPARIVREMVSHKRLGAAANRRGNLNDPDQLNFDAQLMAFDTPELAAGVIDTGISYSGGALKFVPPVGTEMSLALPHRATPLRVRLIVYWADAFPVLDDLMPHRRLLELECLGPRTEEGDSGSPLVVPGERPTLAGMHIARWMQDGEALSLCIPAWDLLNRFLYRGQSASAADWELM